MRFEIKPDGSDCYNVIDTQTGRTVFTEGYQIASQVCDTLNGLPGAKGECREIAKILRKAVQS